MFLYNVILTIDESTSYDEVKFLLEFLKKQDFRKNHLAKQMIRMLLEKSFRKNSTLKDTAEAGFFETVEIKVYRISKNEINTLNMNCEITKHYFERK